MFPARYFPGRYFARRFFPAAGGAAPPSGSYFPGSYFPIRFFPIRFFPGLVTDTVPPVTVTGTFRRPLWSWARVWRYTALTTTRIPPTALTKTASEVALLAASFAECRPVVAGETLSAPEVLDPPAGLTISGIAVTTDDFDQIPAGAGASFRVEGGTAGTVYNFAVRVTTSGGSKPVVPCRLVVTPDHDSE